MDPQFLYALAAFVSALATLVWAIRRKTGPADDGQ
jgi:hypothetical protein